MPTMIRALAELLREPLAMLPSYAETLAQLVEADAGDDDVRAALGARRAPTVPTAGGVAVVRVQGVILPRTSPALEGYATGCEWVTRTLRELRAARNVSRIVVEFNSPGGSVYGVEECFRDIYQARGTKPTLALVSPLCASAAYYLAAACDSITIGASAEAGSIGVFSTRLDASKALKREGLEVAVAARGRYKAFGLPSVPLTDTERAKMLERVSFYYRQFLAAVAAGRSASPAEVEAGFGEGLVLAGEAAVRLAALLGESPGRRQEDCPFPGLAAYDEADAQLFFGRDREIDATLEQLRREPALTIVGPSGAGKTSLVQAGVNRLRPIVMTTLAAIFALLPLALALGRGASMQQPLAVAIISGLLVQIPLVVIFMPLLYRKLAGIQ